MKNTTHHTPTPLTSPDVANLMQVSADVAGQLDAAYRDNYRSLERATAAAQELLALTPDQLDEQTDRAVEDYLVRARKTLALLKERREPFTQAFDRIRTYFVELENSLDPKKAGSITGQLQALRDGYARRLREAELRRQDEIRERAIQQQRQAEQERLLREQAAAAADQQQAEQALRQAEQAAEQARQLQLQVEAAAAQPLPEAPRGRTSVAITVTDPQGYLALLSVYLELQQPTPPLEKLAKVQLGQLVTWAERLAATTGEVVDHPGLTYGEEFKTVAR